MYMTNNRTDLGLKDADAGCACCTTSSANESPAAESSSRVEDVLVVGMTCAHCVSSVTEELTAIDSVDSVTVDLNADGVSRVTIRSTTQVDPVAVQAAIEEAGYALADGPA